MGQIKRRNWMDRTGTHLVVQVLDSERILRQVVLLLDLRRAEFSFELSSLRLALVLDDLGLLCGVLGIGT